MDNHFHKQWVDILNKENAKISKESTDSETPNSYFFIFNNVDNSIEFINSAFFTITGYPKQEIDVAFFLGLVHPDDLDYFFQKELQGQEFTNALRHNELYKYIFKYSYRIRKADGSYILILQEYNAIELTKEGYWNKSLVLHTIQDITQPLCLETDYRIFDKEKGEYLDLINKYNLTSREQEIIQLIKKGLTSKEISNTLYLSPSTIQTHRKNILNKTNSRSFIELIKKLSTRD
ncbi:LuxR C-terminal-related transcriptional regulator [Myroides pelagicus]|uniref:PAS domain-containing protein n=1 Tax=Myroides pelagicus TaxID=270914 RepID=A0A7K1GNX3_9FLAO|nr:LuxR C-terminal-related transcriptional regulator [Myroides pelagicus]MTH30612.1 PAS domain-containing protein [Myroides pelagicus]